MAKLKAVIVVLLLALIAGGGAMFGLNRFYETELFSTAGSQLAQAELLVLDAWRVEAFERIQTLSAESTNETLVTAASKAPTTENQAEDAIQSALTPINEQLAPVAQELQKKRKLENLLILSAEGRVLAQAPGDKFGTSMKGLPAVQECLVGTARDGLYKLAGKLNQVAVAPLEDSRAKVVGCLMTLHEVGKPDATRLSKLSGLQVSIMLGQDAVATTLEPKAVAALAPLLDAEPPIRFGDPTGDIPLLVDFSKKAFLARVVRVPGGTDPVHLAVAVDLGAQLGTLKEAQMMVLYGTGGLLVFGLFLGLLLSGGGPGKQFARLRDSVRLMAEGNGYLVDPDNYSGDYQDLARDLRKVAESGRPMVPSSRAPESVSQILGSRPEREPEPMPETDSGSLDFESLLGGGSPKTSEPIQRSAPPQPVVPVEPPPPVTAPVQPRPAPRPAPPAAPPPSAGGKGPRVEMPGDLASFFDDGDPEATREVPDASEAWDSLASQADQDLSEPVTQAVPTPVAPPRRAPPPPVGGLGFDAPPELDDGGDDDDDQISSSDYRPDATVIAQVPDELLRAASTLSSDSDARLGSAPVPPPPTSLPRPPVSPVGVSRASSPEDAHFQEVFDQFIKTKQECGESVAGLTVDKFVEKLRKNSADLKTRYRCKSVKFQVYVKNGKAALKATPIK